MTLGGLEGKTMRMRKRTTEGEFWEMRIQHTKMMNQRRKGGKVKDDTEQEEQ